jgi:hypothetical protein
MNSMLLHQAVDDLFSHVEYGCSGPLLTTHTAARDEYYCVLAAKVAAVMELDAKLAQRILEFLFVMIKHTGILSKTEEVPPREICFRNGGLFAILCDSRVMCYRLLHTPLFGVHLEPTAPRGVIEGDAIAAIAHVADKIN